ncbi:MAG: hypothetical protein AAGA85_21855, partial [Bacteroidota bacterium]
PRAPRFWTSMFGHSGPDYKLMYCRLLYHQRAPVRVILPTSNKQGICNQCSELNGWLNPKQDQQEAVNRLSLRKGSKKYDREQLYELRRVLVKNIDPLESEGHELQEQLMRCNRIAMGEEPV